jgi:hypothetical protein
MLVDAERGGGHADLGLGQIPVEAQIDDLALAARQRRPQVGDGRALLDHVEAGIQVAEGAVQARGLVGSGGESDVARRL